MPQDVTTIAPEMLAESDFAELDQLEVIESTEIKLSGAYHSYTYYAELNTDDVAGKA